MKKETQSKTAEAFIKELKARQSDAELKKYERYFPVNERKGDQFMGVRMGHIFQIAKEFIDMEPKELEKLLESPIHEIRAGALSIMGKAASVKNVSDERLKELYDLYIRRHDRINKWDLVDLAAYYLVGKYLLDKPRDVLYKLARSKDPWERRTAIVSTWAFSKTGDTNDAFKIAEMLLNEKEDLVQKATGWMVRAAGDVNKKELISFLDKHANKMPRAMLRNSIEKLTAEQKAHYMSLK